MQAEARSIEGEQVHGKDPEGEAFLAQASAEVRRGFVRKVYGILSAQLLLTAVIALPIARLGKTWVLANSWITTLGLVMLMGTMCAMCCCAPMLRKFPQNYFFLLFLTVAESILVGAISAQYTWQSVVLAVCVTAGIFLVMTAFAHFTSVDFTGLGIYLYAALAALIVFGFAVSLLALFGVPVSGALLVYNAFGVLLFTMYIVYDTQLIIGGNHKEQFSIDDYAFAALNLYLDIINLFLYLLQLFGNRD